jgi:hypothetical protein
MLTWGANAAAAPSLDADRLKMAAEEFDSGRRAFKIKDFENAAVHFENADREAPSPEALHSALRARKEAGHITRAATLAALALSRYPTDKAVADYARQVLGELEKSLYKLSVTCLPDCALIVDNKVMPFTESANATVYLDPGPHVVAAGWSNNRHKNADINAYAGGANKISFNAPPLEKPAATAVEPSASPEAIEAPAAPSEIDQGGDKMSRSGIAPIVFYVGAGATAVLAGVTIWSGIDTLNNPGKDAIKQLCAAPNNTTDCPAYQEGLSHERRTNILIAATSVVGVTTAVIGLFFTNWRGDEPAKPDKKDAKLMPVVRFGDGVSIGAVGRF